MFATTLELSRLFVEPIFNLGSTFALGLNYTRDTARTLWLPLSTYKSVEHAQLCYVSHSWHINLVCRALGLFAQRLVARRDLGEPQDFCGKTMQAVTGQSIFDDKNRNFVEFLIVFPGNQPLAKELEDSGYEMTDTWKWILLDVVTQRVRRCRYETLHEKTPLRTSNVWSKIVKGRLWLPLIRITGGKGRIWFTVESNLFWIKDIIYLIHLWCAS